MEIYLYIFKKNYVIDLFGEINLMKIYSKRK